MRAALLLGLALALLAPPAAAGFTLPAGRAYEDALTPGGAVSFTLPVEADQDGALYAKALPTPGDVVTDDPRDDATGWRVGFAILREGAPPEDLGTYADNTMSRLAPVRAGERVTLRVTLHAPADAAAGRHESFVALAFRAGDALDGTAPNGAHMDAARALTFTLHLRGEGLPPPQGELPPVGPIDVGADPATPGGATGADGRPAADAPAAAAALPTWFLAGVLVLLALLVLTTGACAYALLAMRAAARAPEASRAVAVPVRAAEGKPEKPRER